MKCAVKGCSNENNAKACPISFFAFPSNPTVEVQWINFCCRNDAFNPRTSVICMDHFRPEDFSNALMYDMGFTQKRLLCRGAVPSIKKQSARSAKILKEREKQIQNLENKKTVEMLIKEYEATAASVETAPDFGSGVLEETEMPFEFFEHHPSCTKEDNCRDEIERLKSEIELLRGENLQLKAEQQKLKSQLNSRFDRMEKESIQTEKDKNCEDKSHRANMYLKISIPNPEVVLNSQPRKRKITQTIT